MRDRVRLALALHEADIEGCAHRGGYAGLIDDHLPFADRILAALLDQAQEGAGMARPLVGEQLIREPLR